MTDDSDTLLARARAGEAGTLNDLLRAYRPYARVLVRAVLGCRQAAGVEDSDLVQDALLVAFRSFGGFRGQSVGEFVAWLRVITVRTARHRLRQGNAAMQSLDENEVPAPSASPLERLRQFERSAEVAAAIDRLPEAMREIILARHLDDLPHQEIAERRQSTAGAVRILYLRALQRLREELTQP